MKKALVAAGAAASYLAGAGMSLAQTTGNTVDTSSITQAQTNATTAITAIGTAAVAIVSGVMLMKIGPWAASWISGMFRKAKA